MSQRIENLNEVGQWLSRLASSIDVNRALRHQDLYIELEVFFRDLLNLLFGLQLENAETVSDTNQDSFDLFDERNRTVVQVTTTTSALKIRKTLETFIGRHDSQYNRLIFMYPSLSIGKSKADFSKLLRGFDFDAKRDRWSFRTLLKRFQSMPIQEQTALLQLLQRELKPLAKPLLGFRIEEMPPNDNPSPEVRENADLRIICETEKLTAQCTIAVSVETTKTVNEVAVEIVACKPPIEGVGDHSPLLPSNVGGDNERVTIYAGKAQQFKLLACPSSHRTMHVLTVHPGSRNLAQVQITATRQEFTLRATGRDVRPTEICVLVRKDKDQIDIESLSGDESVGQTSAQYAPQ